MAHTASQSAYQRLTERLNRFPQGAPPSKLLTKILMVLFEEKDTERVSLLPIKPFTAHRASRVIETATYRGISMCYCRHKMTHNGRACDAPMNICMTFNTSA
jgi:hypothetical protein